MVVIPRWQTYIFAVAKSTVRGGKAHTHMLYNIQQKGNLQAQSSLICFVLYVHVVCVYGSLRVPQNGSSYAPGVYNQTTLSQGIKNGQANKNGQLKEHVNTIEAQT